jgi:hypothetical protein
MKRNRVESSSVRGKSLGTVLPSVTRSDVHAHLAKRARVVFQVSAAEKGEIRETARGFSMSMSEYLVQLHRLFRRLSGGKTPKGDARRRGDLI